MKVCISLFLTAGFILLFSVAARAEPERPPLLLLLGEQRVLSVPGLAKYSVGSTAIHVAPSPHGKDRLLIKGVNPGLSDIWVWKSDGSSEHRTIQVQKSGADPLSPQLDRLLSRLEETEVYFTGDGVVLRGKLRTLPEVIRLHALLKSPVPGSVHIYDETELDPALLAAAEKKLNEWLKASHYASRLQVTLEETALVLSLVHGSVDGPIERATIERKAQSIFPLTQVRIDALPDQNPTVHFKVYLLELKKSYLRSLGLSWPASVDSALHVTPTRIDANLGLDIAIQALENDGSAKILSNPELVVRAPGEAELFSGGELPIQTQSAYFANVTWKTFGLTLKLNVAQSAGDRVRLDIFTEVSRIDASLSTSSDKIPGIQANRMKTQIDARYGKPLLLSGLLQQSLHKEVKGLPFLKDIPVLGALFGSEDYLSERSELVAILLPSKEVPVAPMEKVTRLFPTGPMPPSREFDDPEGERALRDAPDYPWNVLE